MLSRENKQRDLSVQHHWKGMGRLSTLGLEVALSAIVGLVGGRWLDSKLGTGQWLTLIGFGFGIAAGFRAIYRALQEANRKAERDSAEQRERRESYHKSNESSPQRPSD